MHSCHVCVKFSKDCELLDDSLLLTHFKAFDNEKSIFGGLRIPSEQFIHYIYELEKLFKSSFESICGTSQISHKYFHEMKKVVFNHPCPLFPSDYLIKLFIRLKIYYTLKYSNREQKIQNKTNKKGKKNRKVTILSHL